MVLLITLRQECVLVGVCDTTFFFVVVVLVVIVIGTLFGPTLLVDD